MVKYKNKAQYLSSLPDKCALCGNSDCDDYVPVYWNNAIIDIEDGNIILHRRVHKDCKSEQRAYEAFECQTIDADCNDCGYFKRERNYKVHATGKCLKFNKLTKAYPQFASGHECFVHRKVIHNNYKNAT